MCIAVALTHFGADLRALLTIRPLRHQIRSDGLPVPSADPRWRKSLREPRTGRLGHVAMGAARVESAPNLTGCPGRRGTPITPEMHYRFRFLDLGRFSERYLDAIIA